MEVDEAKHKILELQRQIFKLVNEFEETTGLYVESVHLDHAREFTETSMRDVLFSVDVTVKVPKP